ncbi:nudix hydrolase 9 isoform X1 [Rhododendron vialii]|uniref:nudix hydrolase 9 isoform X1 n=1 Tax=Rhododendron vialii TaxID=182163 RepID=UPI00265F754F|nr:nudix hydrolase 9 isoform X1 [Rhododendron vialii]
MEKANPEQVGDCPDRPPYELLLICPSGLSPSQVSVVFDEAYDRIPHPAIDLENSVSEIWDLRVQQNSSLFNGKKFRYGGHALLSGADSDHLPRVCLHLGLTDYRTFVGTNLNPMWEKFLVPSEDDCRKCQHTSSPLGNGAVVETSDKKILVLQRSYNVGEFPGHYVFPGGHPEPEAVGIVSHQYAKDSNNAELISNRVSQEMFDSIIREVVEEIGVPATTLCNPDFIGISRRDLNMRPTAFFFIKCNLQSKEIQQFYSRAQDGYESTQLYTVSMKDLEIMASKMPGCHQGGFALYKLMVEVAKHT